MEKNAFSKFISKSRTKEKRNVIICNIIQTRVLKTQNLNNSEPSSAEECAEEDLTFRAKSWGMGD